MKINQKILSIPPYISTAWKNIASLHVEATEDEQMLLVITLLNGTNIEIPQLDMSIIEAIFAAHAKFMEQDGGFDPRTRKALTNNNTSEAQIVSFGFPMRLGAEGTDKLGGVVQHKDRKSVV